MSAGKPVNVSVSVRQRLLNKSREGKRALPNEITAFSPEFIELKQVQWMAFKKRLGQEQEPDKFEKIVEELKTFLKPIVLVLQRNSEFTKTWLASMGWN